MAVYYKPQSPIQSGEDFIYPITTADQVKVDKDTRLNAVGVYLKNIDNSTDTTVYGNNATTLGGVAAEDYALKTDTAPDSSKLGGVAASDYALKTDTAPDSSKLGGKAPEYYLQPRNLLDNSDFRNLVNQRGQTSYNSVGYTIDRWTKESNAILTIADDCINIDNSANSTDEVVIQKVDSDTAAKLIGKAVTIAICTSDGTVYAKSGVVAYDVPVALIEHNGFTFQLQFFRNFMSYQVARLIIWAGSNISVKWVALYEGSYTADTLPPYVPKGYAAELAECTRYFEVINFTSVFSKKNYEGNIIYCAVNFGVKRVNPTITIKNLYSPGTYSQSQLGTLTIGDKEKTCVQLLSSFVDAEGKCVWGRLEVSADL